ncbi:roadblock/LC7 domain-containing protein [Streptomyces sp. NPDC096132]|uniref:roadblock/LC7 domain-containing protein n=1 Tax=Streptomyces sp. NPDC096132 TaxID=3366075 RepID=UPI00380F9B7D
MAAGPEILDELRRLRARVPQLTGALAAGVDGLVLAHDTPGVEPEGVAALTAASLGVAVRLADSTGQGDFRELLVRGVYGYVATYAAGGSAVLTVLAQDRVNVGRLHLEGRRAGARIGELVDAHEAKARETRAREPKAVPAKPPAQPPVRTPAKPSAAPLWTRSARDTSTNARTTTESREEPRNTSWPTPKLH